MEIQAGAVDPVGNIQDGWNIIKDDYWTFFLMTLVLIVIVIGLALILGGIGNVITGVVSLALGVAAKDSGNAGKVSAAIVPELIGLVIGAINGIIIGTFSGIMLCGYMNAVQNKISSGIANFSDLFSGFKYFQQCLIVTTIISLFYFAIEVIGILIGVAFGVSVGTGMLLKNGKFDPSALSGLIGIGLVLLLIFLVISIVVSICTAFVYPLISQKNLSGFEALSASARGGLSNALPLLGFLILQGLIGIAGALLCGIGLLFVLPVIYSSLFSAYRSVYGGQTDDRYQPPPAPPIFNN